MIQLNELEKTIAYTFNNEKSLSEALTHPSYSAEAKHTFPDNQRLEFLGDAVIQIVVTRKIYYQFPTLPEGDLTKIRAVLSKESTLAGFARKLELGKFLNLGHGEKKNKGERRDSMLCDAFEALIGAMYIDCGHEFREIATLLNRLIDATFQNNDLKSLIETENPKGSLQEWTQKNLDQTPVYKMINATGPDHDKVFTSGVYINKECFGKGSAKKRQSAEENAARSALEKIENNSGE